MKKYLEFILEKVNYDDELYYAVYHNHNYNDAVNAIEHGANVNKNHNYLSYCAYNELPLH